MIERFKRCDVTLLEEPQFPKEFITQMQEFLRSTDATFDHLELALKLYSKFQLPKVSNFVKIVYNFLENLKDELSLYVFTSALKSANEDIISRVLLLPFKSYSYSSDLTKRAFVSCARALFADKPDPTQAITDWYFKFALQNIGYTRASAMSTVVQNLLLALPSPYPNHLSTIMGTPWPTEINEFYNKEVLNQMRPPVITLHQLCLLKDAGQLTLNHDYLTLLFRRTYILFYTHLSRKVGANQPASSTPYRFSSKNPEPLFPIFQHSLSILTFYWICNKAKELNIDLATPVPIEATNVYKNAISHVIKYRAVLQQYKHIDLHLLSVSNPSAVVLPTSMQAPGFQLHLQPAPEV